MRNLTPDRLNGTRQGFTLIELLVVVVIIGILVSIAIPRLMDVRKRAFETETASNLSDIQKALESFGTDNNGMYPFRIRWFDDATYNDVNFDPYEATDTGTGRHSDANSYFSLGIWGGVRVVRDDFSDNTNNPIDQSREWRGMREHKVVQPFGWDLGFYQTFNQYSDPLVALGYLDAYPRNPFLKRPMGNIMWGYGDANWQGGGSTSLNKTIPHPEVVTTPGDFVYTFFYETDGTTIMQPQGVVEAKKSYQVSSPSTQHDGMYYIDMIDSYHLWAYGTMPMNGTMYVCYPNNAGNFVARGINEAKKDFDGSGTKDMYEMGMIAYFKRTGTNSSLATDSGGQKTEF